MSMREKFFVLTNKLQFIIQWNLIISANTINKSYRNKDSTIFFNILFV